MRRNIRLRTWTSLYLIFSLSKLARVLDFRRCWESTDNQIADEMKRIETEDNAKNYDHGVKSTLETYYFMHDLIQKSI